MIIMFKESNEYGINNKNTYGVYRGRSYEKPELIFSSNNGIETFNWIHDTLDESNIYGYNSSIYYFVRNEISKEEWAIGEPYSSAPSFEKLVKGFGRGKSYPSYMFKNNEFWISSYNEGWEPDIYVRISPNDLEYIGSATDNSTRQTEYTFKHKEFNKFYRTQKGVLYTLSKTGRASSKTNLTTNDVLSLVDD